MDGAIDPAAAEQRRIGGVDDGVDVERGDVGDDDGESGWCPHYARLFALIPVLCLPSPAGAQQPSPADQFKHAVNVYYGGKTSTEEYLTGYIDVLLAGAEGLWFGFSPEFAKQDVAALLDRACGGVGYFRLQRTSDYSFTLTRNPGSERPVVYTYVSMGGGVFSLQVDPEQLMNWVFPGPEGPEADRSRALNSASGIAAIYRPSPDILVVHTNFAIPTIYVRCP